MCVFFLCPLPFLTHSHFSSSVSLDMCVYFPDFCLHFSLAEDVNYYKILGVNKKVNDKDLKRAYRKLSLKVR